MAYILKTDGTTAITDDLSLEALQKAVGGPIELIDLGDSTILVVNEEGKLRSLPFNMRATEQLSHWGETKNIMDPILGDAVLLHGQVEIDKL